MPSTNLLKRDWEKDHVYLIQFPRPGCIPSSSPYALKLETFLRVADIPYTNISNEFTKMSSRGQIPFIELNGQQYADSSLIIDHLIKQFQKSHLESLSATDSAISRAFYSLLEHHLAWVTVYSRGQDSKWVTTDQGYGRAVTGIKAFAFKTFLAGRFQKRVQERARAQGIGTFSKEEIIDLAKKDLDALSTQLAGKQFLFGDDIKVIDIVAFAHLSELLYTPQFSAEIKNHVEASGNLQGYVDRIKAKYWPDWTETCETQNMNTKWK